MRLMCFRLRALAKRGHVCDPASVHTIHLRDRWPAVLGCETTSCLLSPGIELVVFRHQYVVLYEILSTCQRHHLARHAISRTPKTHFFSGLWHMNARFSLPRRQCYLALDGSHSHLALPWPYLYVDEQMTSCRHEICPPVRFISARNHQITPVMDPMSR